MAALMYQLVTSIDRRLPYQLRRIWQFPLTLACCWQWGPKAAFLTAVVNLRWAYGWRG